jgi:chorismate-pyruvate lyase
MRVGTPLGEYPFEFRRVERRGDGLAVIGIVAGLESSVVVTVDDVRAAARRIAVPLGALALLLVYSRSR